MQEASQPAPSNPLRRALNFFDNKVLDAGTAPGLQLGPIPARQLWIELLLLLLAVTVYCVPPLGFGTLNPLRGNEAEVFQSLDQELNQSIHSASHFPLWNPYIFSGIPYAADPMLHAYNPFIALPVLLFGTLNGFKIAVALGFLIGALGMWWLARVMGLGVAGRLWMGLLYAFSGAAMSRFYQGQYLLQIAIGWLPWIIASLYAALRMRRRKHLVVAALALALLFMCGNAYYAYYTLYAVAILAVVMLLRLRWQPLHLGIDLAGLNTLATIGILAVGLIAAQLLPLTGFWSRISKDTDQSLKGSQSAQQALQDFLSTDAHRPDAIATLPPEEFYAYIGVVPFILLLLLPLAWRKGNRRILLYMILLAVFTVIWIDVRDMPWKGVFQSVPFLYQFRYPTRMLVFGTIALAALSGMAIDGLVRRFDSLAASLGSGWQRFIPTGMKYAVLAALAASVVSVAASHQKEMAAQTYYPAPDTVLGWLRQHDQSIYYIYAPNGWHRAVVQDQMRYLNAWYHFGDIRQTEDQSNVRDVQATPKYEILGNDAAAPSSASLVKRFEQHTIYLHPDSLSFGFTVPTATLGTLRKDGSPLKQAETSPVDVFTTDTDSLESIISGRPGQTLVILSTLMPGWSLQIDNRSMPILNVSGYLATPVLSGTHRYLFTYRAPGLFTGWLISTAFLLLSLALVASDALHEVQSALARLRQIDWQGHLPGLPKPSGDAQRRPQPIPGLQPVARARRVFGKGAFGESDSVLAQVKYWLGSLREAVASRISWTEMLFGASIGVYLLAVLYHNSDFPIFFFTDEAVHMNEAANLLLHGWQNGQHEFLPTYFNIGTMFSLNSLSVYLQVIPYMLFGKSESVTRGVSGIVTAFGAIAAGLSLRNVFKIKQYWLGPLLLIATPAWFLHSRTAFEYAELAAFYAIFLYCYLEYRAGRQGYLYAAVIAGAAAFYTHGLGQVLIGVSGLALFIIDFRYHIRTEARRSLYYAAGLVGLMALPYLRYQFAHPDVTAGELSQRGSYLVDSGLTLLQKSWQFIQLYTYGLNPLYWYLPNDHDLVRHVMKGYGHIWIATLPFALCGLYRVGRKIADPKYRVLLVALLAAPLPASLVGVGVIRELWVLVPITLLTAIGLVSALDWLQAKTPKPARFAPTLLFAILTVYTLLMLRDALTNGPTWYQDYTLYGMQYGGRQVFVDTVLHGVESNKRVDYVVSPNWANGTDQLLNFFIPTRYSDRVSIDSIDSFMADKKPIGKDSIFVILPDEYTRAKASPVFSKLKVVGTIPDPNGKPGFYLLRIAYANNADTIFAQLAAARRQPVQGSVTVQGQPAIISYSQIEAGQPSDMFDGKLESLVRGVEANPFIIDLVFDKPMQMSKMTGTFSHMGIRLQVGLYENEEDTPMQFEATELNAPDDPTIDVNFGKSYLVKRVHIEITDLDMGAGQPAKIHVRELQFTP